MEWILLYLTLPQDDALRALQAERSERAAGKAVRRLLRGHDLSIDDWSAAIERLAPPAPEAADGPFEITMTLPGGRDWPCLVRLSRGYDPAKPTPLVIVLPGTGAEPDMMHELWAPVAAESEFLFAFPKLLYVSTGRQFKADERRVPTTALREMKRRFNVDEDRVFLAGVSKGGHASWDVGTRFPQLFAGIAPESGRILRWTAGDGLRRPWPGPNYAKPGRAEKLIFSAAPPPQRPIVPRQRNLVADSRCW